MKENEKLEKIFSIISIITIFSTLIMLFYTSLFSSFQNSKIWFFAFVVEIIIIVCFGAVYSILTDD